MSDATIDCARCGRTTPPLPRPPVPGEAGRDIAARICPECWGEWSKMEVMVINELRLNFMDPSAQEVLEREMKKFLFLAETPHLPDHPDQQDQQGQQDQQDRPGDA
jgi:Fe-S cluster biosynthesis and repair protein YggX